MKKIRWNHIIKRVGEEIKATHNIAKRLSWKQAIITFRAKVDMQIMVHNGGIEYEWIKRHLMKKHEVMKLYFEKEFKDFLPQKFENNENDKKDLNNVIWVCWWQGSENMPITVKKCFESINRNAGNHKVIVLTEENYKNYVQFPSWIMEKYKLGIISKTHLSDILRLELLSRYGGMWLDATFFCIDKLDKYFELPLWTIKRPDYRHSSVACGEFATYSFACKARNSYIFERIKQYIYEYWRRYDFVVDYLFLDYIISYVIDKDEKIKLEFDKIKPNNLQCDNLLKSLNRMYNEEEWEKIKNNTELFKLSWKKSFKRELNGSKTFYGKLIMDY